MGLWGARQDLEFIYRFRNSTIEFLNAHNAMVQQAQQQQESAYHSFRPHQDQIQLPAEEYSTLREQYVRGIPRATALAHKHEVEYVLKIFPPPAVGGAIQTHNVFNYAIENQKLGYKLDPYKLKDIIDKTIEGCDQEFKLERQRLFNPFYWIYNLLAFTLRIPFMLIQLTGFDVSKVEDHFISKLFKLAFLVGICYVLSSWFGFTKDDLKELIPDFRFEFDIPTLRWPSASLFIGARSR